MPAQGQRDPAREQYWRDMIDKYQASGMSKTEFCAAEGIKASALCFWERTIKKRDYERMVEARQEKREAREKARRKASKEKLKAKSAKQTRREDFWRRALARFAASGLTKEQFCDQERLFAPTFSYWAQVILGEQPGPMPVESVTSPPTFVPVIVSSETSPPTPSRRAIAELPFAGGSILLFDGVAQQTILAFLRAVNEVNQ